MIEEGEYKVIEKLAFEFDCELPYKHIKDFCDKFLPITSKDSIFELSVNFCNDSFKVPLCLYYHPKIVGAACIYMAAQWRKSKGIEQGLPLQLFGHPWFKWVDASIEQKDIGEVI